MNRIELRIGADGCVRALWTDEIDWRALGQLSVRRASHVEFCARRQLWYVRAGRPRGLLRRLLQHLLRRPCGEILHRATTRRDALTWEQRYFGPDGEGWMAERTLAALDPDSDVRLGVSTSDPALRSTSRKVPELEESTSAGTGRVPPSRRPPCPPARRPRSWPASCSSS